MLISDEPRIKAVLQRSHRLDVTWGLQESRVSPLADPPADGEFWAAAASLRGTIWTPLPLVELVSYERELSAI